MCAATIISARYAPGDLGESPFTGCCSARGRACHDDAEARSWPNRNASASFRLSSLTGHCRHRSRQTAASYRRKIILALAAEIKRCASTASSRPGQRLSRAGIYPAAEVSDAVSTPRYHDEMPNNRRRPSQAKPWRHDEIRCSKMKRHRFHHQAFAAIM